MERNAVERELEFIGVVNFQRAVVRLSANDVVNASADGTHRNVSAVDSRRYSRCGACELCSVVAVGDGYCVGESVVFDVVVVARGNSFLCVGSRFVAEGYCHRLELAVDNNVAEVGIVVDARSKAEHCSKGVYVAK